MHRRKWPQFDLLTLLVITAAVGLAITTWRAMVAKPGEPLAEHAWVIGLGWIALGAAEVLLRRWNRK